MNIHAAKPVRAGWNFDNSYARLPETLFVRVKPEPVRGPRLVLFNRALAGELGLDPRALEGEEGSAIFAGNRLPAGAEPIAQAYAGHQFGYFTMLGDGRAILLGEQIAPDGRRLDVQLKGSGRTPFSRNGDGRAALGPMLREYLVGEAMHALGIPTTRSLAVTATGETVRRETMLPGAVLVRVAASHVRAGTFEYLLSQRDLGTIRVLADYVLKRHYPELAGAGNPYLALYSEVIRRQADLVARWLHAGFIHGVMNTDNMSICGETIDYGPCAFMDAYDPETVFSSIDQAGRYAYGNQPDIAQWNLARFGETLLPLLDPDSQKALVLAEEAIASFPGLFRQSWLSGMRGKLGLFTSEDGDLSLAQELLSCMRKTGADFAWSFRELASERPGEAELFRDEGFLRWRWRWQDRLGRQPQSQEEARGLMRRRNPAVVPRNYFVEEALKAAVEDGDMGPMERFLAVLSRPYDDLPQDSPYGLPPAGSGLGYRTFCGT